MWHCWWEPKSSWQACWEKNTCWFHNPFKTQVKQLMKETPHLQSREFFDVWAPLHSFNSIGKSGMASTVFLGMSIYKGNILKSRGPHGSRSPWTHCPLEERSLKLSPFSTSPVLCRFFEPCGPTTHNAVHRRAVPECIRNAQFQTPL